MNAQQRKELEMLADGLLKVPAEKFDMNRWAHGTLNTEDPAFNCAFAGCAIGWAPKLIPNCGLRFDSRQDLCGSRPYLTPIFEGASSYLAVVRYFGISFTDAEYLFSPKRYPDGPRQIFPSEVSARIKEFLAAYPMPAEVAA